jgi:hypothetical protein
VVVCDFDFVGIAVLPAKTEAILLVDPDTVLSRSIPPEPFQAVSWRYLQVLQGLDAV